MPSQTKLNTHSQTKYGPRTTGVPTALCTLVNYAQDPDIFPLRIDKAGENQAKNAGKNIGNAPSQTKLKAVTQNGALHAG